MTLETSSAVPVEPAPQDGGKPSVLPVVSFLILVVILSVAIFLGQATAWFMEQLALTSHSMDALSIAGKAWFLIQVALVALVSGLAFAFSRDNFRPVYRGWLLASLVTLPALALRFIGPNQDQLGVLFQIALGLVAGTAILLNRRPVLDMSWRPALTALAIVPLAIWPFLLWGALGSGPDVLLNLLAGLAFGLLAAGLLATSTHNFLLDGLGAGMLLLILGTAFGYDGGQLLLMAILPAFGFALVALSPSIPAVVIGLGLLTAAPLIFIDPTELGIVLGDLFPWATRAAALMITNGFLIGLGLWLLRKWNDRPRMAVLPAGIAVMAWVVAFAAFALFGLPGFHGDQLFVILKDQADLSQAAGIKDHTQRAAYVYKTLRDEANLTQAPLRMYFDRLGIHYTPYYLVNGMEVDGGTLVRLYLLTQPEVDRVLASPHLRPLPEKSAGMTGDVTSVSENPGWNIKMIGADRVWSDFGVTGKGIVIGQSDTGADGSHPALKAAYRGLTAGGDYNWYDPWNHTKAPTDNEGHGTHTLGTMLGSGGIGVAPGAQWIGCVNLDRNLGNPAVYLKCMQFLLAPFPQIGDAFHGDPSRGANVLNNSWGCPTIEGCDPNVFKPAADALRAAGIFVVVSTGNDGPNCSTVTDPLSLYSSVFSVGAVDSTQRIAYFSSRGPVLADGSGRVKPDIVAPGVDVFSSLPGGTYGTESGTSMAGPHLVGVVALLWSANPALIGDIDRTDQILIQTARPRREQGYASDCSAIMAIPNNTYGYGLVDAYAAVKMALGK